MKGQTAPEMLILLAGILISVAGMLYIGTGSNESAVVFTAARLGAENAAGALTMEYGCKIEVENLSLRGGTITVSVIVIGGPPEEITWENFKENVVGPRIREDALKFIAKAIGGSFPATARPVTTSYQTYDVATEVRRVVK